MRPTVTQIELKNGLRVTLRCNPYVYEIATEKGFKVESGMTNARTMQVYAGLAYCAALCDWQIRTVDDPARGEFPYTYADFDAWAWGNQEDFMRFVNFFMEALSGKSVAELVNEHDVKKKTSKNRRCGWITRILKRS